MKKSMQTRTGRAEVYALKASLGALSSARPPDSLLCALLNEACMYSSTESVESSLDVIVHFTDVEWQKAKRDLAWATSLVIEELRRHKSSPEEYFAIRPFWAARLLPWEYRIKMEIRGHFWTNDRDIRFSEWWIVKLLR